MGPSQEKISALEKRMKALGICPEDIEEKFIKAGGRGGQKVNKSNSAVFLRHKGIDLCVKCQATRSQHLNRFLALRLLVDKIEAHMKGNTSKENMEIEKIRKQKMRRKRKNKTKQASQIDP
ncbi:MAG: peptide chain release factor-like protein [Pseudomonadota bacterium]